MKHFECKDVGMDCEWSTDAKDENEVLQRVEAHAKEEHGLESIPEDFRQKIRSSITEQKAA